MKKLMSKINVKNLILQIFVVIIGSFLLSFGNVVFLEPASINAGGLNGIAIIVQQFFRNGSETVLAIAYNVTIYSLSIILWIIGLIFLGKDFALKTLLSSIMFPVGTAFFSFMPGVSDWCVAISNAILPANPEIGSILLAGITGGVLVGVGVSITFVGGGSSGGVDVITFLMNKYLNIKQSIGSFIVDGSIILGGLVVVLSVSGGNPNFLVQCFCGIISALISAMLIEYVYIGSQTSYKAEIISSKWKEISAYVQDVLGRGATIIHAQGGYKGEERIILSVVFDKSQYVKIRDFIVKTDPNAFITFTQTNAVYGEGFKRLFSKKKKEKK